MAAIKFGVSQISKPTPANWSNGIQIFTVIAAVVVAWIGTNAAAFIPARQSGIIQSILGLLITIANGLKPFLGISTSQTTVPIEQVAEMETKPVVK